MMLIRCAAVAARHSMPICGAIPVTVCLTELSGVCLAARCGVCVCVSVCVRACHWYYVEHGASSPAEIPTRRVYVQQFVQ